MERKPCITRGLWAPEGRPIPRSPPRCWSCPEEERNAVGVRGMCRYSARVSPNCHSTAAARWGFRRARRPSCSIWATAGLIGRADDTPACRSFVVGRDDAMFTDGRAIELVASWADSAMRPTVDSGARALVELRVSSPWGCAGPGPPLLSASTYGVSRVDCFAERRVWCLNTPFCA
jgi:hypothetical protein